MSKFQNCNSVFYRVENKYALSSIDFELMRSKFSSLLQLDQGGKYRVSSLYFDDDQDTCLFNTINGYPVRDKFRIRIYNDSFATIKMEHKCKNYSYTHKDSVKIHEKDLYALVEGKTINSSHDVANIYNQAITTRLLRPKVIITYERTAFLYEKGNVRITFDENLRASKQVFKFGDKNLVYDFPQQSFKVVEVKYSTFLPDFIRQLLNEGNMWKSANSKYRICREIY